MPTRLWRIRILLTFFQKTGLHDLHSVDPAPSTYIGSANRRIDFILGCDEVLQYVCRSGSLAYTEGPQSDHRGLYVDLSKDFITSPPWQSIIPPTSRDLHTGNPDMVEKYHEKMLEYYEHHRMVERLQTIYDMKDMGNREDIRQALIKWDNDQGRAMEMSERSLRRPPQKMRVVTSTPECRLTSTILASSTSRESSPSKLSVDI